MKKFILLIFILNTLDTMGQFLNWKNIPVIENNDTILNPFSGGLNACQFSNIDLNFDGIQDLFVFDRAGNRSSAYVLENNNGNSEFIYEYAISKKFPDLTSWVLLSDYNCDNKADIFYYNDGYVGVYKNISSQNELEFVNVSSSLVSDLGSISSGIYVSYVDIPAIVDVDNDGDLDILTFQQSGGYIEYHKNLSQEMYNNCDSLIFEMETNCWGGFYEGLNTYELNSCPDPAITPFLAKSNGPHSGSSCLALDIDGDNDKDIILGDVSFNNLNLLINGGTEQNATMNAVSQDFPLNQGANVAVDLKSFPAAFYVDVNNDNIRDLIVSPNENNNSENYHSIELYTNNQADNNPSFTFVQNDFLQTNTIDFGTESYPSSIDYNNDNLLDLVVGNFGYYDNGNQTSKLALMQNVGTSENPVFKIIDRDFGGLSQIPLNTTLNEGVSGIYPTFGDLDNDGDKDMMIGDANGKLHYFENTANPGENLNIELSEVNVSNFDLGQFATPFLFDMDNDEDLDLVIGQLNGSISYAENTGDAENYEYNSLISNFGNIDVSNDQGTYGYSKPFVYFEDNELNLLIGSESGYIYHYNNISENLDGNFNLVNNNFKNIREGKKSAISFIDLDNDDKRDLILGNFSGGLFHFKNQEFSSNASTYNTSDEIIYPNPSNGIFHFKQLKNVHLSIHNLTGEKVWEQKQFSGNQIDLRHLNNGVYFLLHNSRTPQINKIIIP